MNGYLLDTNVLSEVIRKRPADSVLRRLRALAPEALFTSSICVMELRFGAARVPHGVALWQRIRREVLPLVGILPVGEAAALRAGETLAALESRGERIGVEDLLIASTALTHGLAVATRNVKHLSRVAGLVVESWWS
ncbi:MAG: PIN domain-containing protein [Deltaproteobacteria bacterium]|nr:PIN domain-containing protein [Deltaproteobacteria bacterium]